MARHWRSLEYYLECFGWHVGQRYKHRDQGHQELAVKVLVLWDCLKSASQLHLHGARLKQKITQEALAKKAGVDRKTINRIENGWFSPSMDTFFRVCGALGVKPVDVLKQANKVKK